MIKNCLIFLFLYLALSGVCSAAVSRQNTVPVASKGGAITTLSWSHTVNAGSDLLLVVGVSIDDAATYPTGVTYNGVAMTNIANQPAGGSFSASSAWKMTNPPTGANTVQVTFGVIDNFSSDSISFSGVDQTTPIANINQGSSPLGNNPSINITTAVGDYAYAVLAININQTPLTVSPGTLEWEADNYGAGSSATGSGATSAAVATTTNITWSWTNANDYSYIAFAVQQVQSVREQEGYRFRNDDGSETTATWLAAQDTAISRDLATNTRLRVLVNSPDDPSSTQYQLEYKKSTDSTYKKVEVPSGSLAFGTAGAAAAGTTSLSVAYPATISAGDLLVLAVANKYPNNGPSTPAGWTKPSNCQGSGGQGASGVDTGSMYSTVYVKEADGTESGNLTVTVTSGNSAMGAMLRYTKGAGKNWSYACTNGSDNSGNANSWSATGAADPDISAGDIVVVGSAINTDAYTFSSEALTAAGITLGAETERIDTGTANGQDCKLVVSDHVISTGTSTAAPVFAMTSSGNAANNPAGASSILRLRQINQPIQMSASANITANGENTTAQLTAPAGKSTSDFVTGRMQDDENPADPVDITANAYTELEWSMIATSSANYGEIYQFRVTSAGSALSTYSVTPQWTIASGSSTPPKNSSMFMNFE